MDKTKVQIGNDVLLDIGTHSDWYISVVSYDGESVDIKLHRKTDQYKEWWLADTPQFDSGIPKNALRSDCTGCRFVGAYDTQFPCVNCVRKNKDYYDSE